MSGTRRFINLSCALALLTTAAPGMAAETGQYPWNYPGVLPREPRPAAVAGACAAPLTQPRVLIAGDSWAQYLWDDDAHNEIFDKFGHADKRALSRSLGSNPGAGYSGPEYAISGSEAREWVDTANYPWIANVVAELQAQPSIDTVMLSLGGNDILAGRSGGGWYKQMDLDSPGSEAALFARIMSDTTQITQAMLAVRPDLDLLLSSYEYPNFNVSALWCWIYACPKREDLSRDPSNALVTDIELNAMNLEVESQRIAWTNADPRRYFDHGVGEMHYYYGDGVSNAGVLPRPGQQAPDYLPFPGGNPLRPSLRENFRVVSGIPADPIHLDPEGYLYKVAVQTESYFFPRFRQSPGMTLQSEGGLRDGWTDGNTLGTSEIAIGDDGSRLTVGLVSFDTSAIPADVDISGASLYLLQEASSGSNPLIGGNLGNPRLDLATGSFGQPEVELSDASAPADAADVGCFVGTARDRYYALRIDLSAAGIAAINRSGVTQLRLRFSQVDPGVNRLAFADGDAVLQPKAQARQRFELVEEGGVTRVVMGTVLEHRGLAEVMGSARPFLDLQFATELLADGFESPP
ncbi:MAG: hypothetical protein KDI71_18800 [Xanthomonadales bacterium]|nr:hypothetical protein [Xanthomonadales bacterium]